MKAKIEVDMDNAAFDHFPLEELANILDGLTKDLWEGLPGIAPATATLRDSNGNRVGRLVIED